MASLVPLEFVDNERRPKYQIEAMVHTTDRNHSTRPLYFNFIRSKLIFAINFALS